MAPTGEHRRTRAASINAPISPSAILIRHRFGGPQAVLPAQFYVLAGLSKVFGTSVLVERAWDTVVVAAAFSTTQRPAEPPAGARAFSGGFSRPVSASKNSVPSDRR